jgi:hypothetical protein
MINGSTPADTPTAPAPSRSGPAVASADQPAPASGAFSVGALGYSAD